MQPSVSLSAAAPTAIGGARGRPFWLIFAGGLLVGVGTVAAGVLVLAESLGLGPTGFPPDFTMFESILVAGAVLRTLGFFLGFVGIVFGLRAPSPGVRTGVQGNLVWTVLLGGVLLLLSTGIGGATSIANLVGYNLYAAIGFQMVYVLADASVLLSALGFFLAFFGIALAFRTRG